MFLNLFKIIAYQILIINIFFAIFLLLLKIGKKAKNKGRILTKKEKMLDKLYIIMIE